MQLCISVFIFAFHCEYLTQVSCVVQNQPFLKLLSMLVELAGGPPGMPPFMNFVLQKFWEVKIFITFVMQFSHSRERSLRSHEIAVLVLRPEKL